MSKITVIGIGPGSQCDITGAAIFALQNSNVIIGYKYYFQFIEPYIIPDAQLIDSAMKQEETRARIAFEKAMEGNDVSVISSGDSSIYGMAPLIYEMRHRSGNDIEIEIIPGISAFQKAASILGAPIGHDFCVISLSDLMTPWHTIERRITAAAQADFITAVYNPKSHGRYWQLHRLKEIFMEWRKPSTPVGYVRQAGRPDQSVTVTTLSEFDPEQIDMFTIVIIGNERSYIDGNHIITPRGYYQRQESADVKLGQDIMIRSFRTIESELKNKDIPVEKKWAILHAIHTTADFEMENLVKVDDGALQSIYQALSSGRVKTIVTDVTMAASGIRKGALQRLGIDVKCFLGDDDVIELSKKLNITRTQAGIRKAVNLYPDALYVFGNAPTALSELCSLMRAGKASPCGIVAAPVGFVHVCESKHMVKTFHHTPKIIVEGRKGGSNLAATLVNSILCLPDAQLLNPGRDV